jgi:ribulose-phosphate 3-epimerase
MAAQMAEETAWEPQMQGYTQQTQTETVEQGEPMQAGFDAWSFGAAAIFGTIVGALSTLATNIWRQSSATVQQGSVELRQNLFQNMSDHSPYLPGPAGADSVFNASPQLRSSLQGPLVAHHATAAPEAPAQAVPYNTEMWKERRDKRKPGACDISPSLLACNLARLGEEGATALNAGADSLHVDVMDGHFVPNISWGMPVVASLSKELGPTAFLDVHLMVSAPEKWVDSMKESGAHRYTFHVEATEKPRELCKQIMDAGMVAGVSLKPGTKVDDTEVIQLAKDGLIDLILIMTVEPGFGGQSFMVDMMPKVKQIREALGPDFDIQVDGGLSPDTIGAAADAGANVIVAGSAVFKPDPPPEKSIAMMREAVDKAVVAGAK